MTAIETVLLSSLDDFTRLKGLGKPTYVNTPHGVWPGFLFRSKALYEEAKRFEEIDGPASPKLPAHLRRFLRRRAGVKGKSA
jgi:hypothetical protein